MTLVPDDTLLTPTPEDGRALALELARLTIKAIQPDDTTRNLLRSG